MSPSTEETARHRTQLFSVVGAPYIAEQRGDESRHVVKPPDAPPPETGVAGIWLVFYVALAAISLITTGGAARLIAFASVMLN